MCRALSGFSRDVQADIPQGCPHPPFLLLSLVDCSSNCCVCCRNRAVPQGVSTFVAAVGCTPHHTSCLSRLGLSTWVPGCKVAACVCIVAVRHLASCGGHVGGCMARGGHVWVGVCLHGLQPLMVLPGTPAAALLWRRVGHQHRVVVRYASSGS